MMLSHDSSLKSSDSAVEKARPMVCGSIDEMSDFKVAEVGYESSTSGNAASDRRSDECARGTTRGVR